MKKQQKLKLLSLFLAIVMLVLAMPMNVFAVDATGVDEGNATTRVNGLKDYSMPSNEKHAYDPFAQLESEEATKEYRDSVQYVAGSIIYKVNETKGWFGGYKEKADGDDLSEMGIALSSAQELSRKRVKNGFFTDTYEVIYEASLDGDVWETVDALAQTEGVVDAQPNYLYEHTAVEISSEISKNPDKGKQWYHKSLDVDKQWKELYKQGITPGEGTIVAVIDTGVDYTHTDLAANMWVNTAEFNGKPGVDDDGNGYVDDIYGCSTVGATYYHSGDPMDDHGHGTHVAGIIGMSANNGEGGVGIAYGAKIMAIKAGQATGVFSDTDIAEAINYAVTMGADVINMSFGGMGRSFLVEEALANAFGTCVLVAAAGNDGIPTADAPADFTKKADFYPAGYSYVLGVMATDEDGNLASFSNWDYYNNGGTAEYELAAPGVDIFSTLPGNQYAVWDGTSMAAPMVAAAAAVIRSFYPDRDTYSSRFIMGQLASATDEVVNYRDKIGKVHTYSALDIESALNDLPTPNIIVKNTYLFDDPAIAPENDGDGIIDAGETIDLGLVLRNQWGMAGNVTVKVDAISVGGVANPNIEWITDTITMEDIGTFNEQNNGFVYEDDMLVGADNPIRFKVKSDTINDANIGFNITITCTNALDKNDTTVYTFDPKRGFDLTFYVQRGRSLSGTIKENMTLTSEDYWIIENSVYIPEGITVTVEPGTQIQFWPSEYNATTNAYIQIDGTFHVNGTEEAPVEMFPSSAFANFGVDIRGGLTSTNGYGFHPNATTIGESKLSYVNILNPRLSFNTGDHLYIVQNSQDIRYRNTNSSTSSSGSILITKKLCDSIVKNSSFSDFLGSFEQVIFEGCVPNSTTDYTSFKDCTFIGDNIFTQTSFQKSWTNSSAFKYQMPRSTFTAIGSYNGSKYVLLEMPSTFLFYQITYQAENSTKYDNMTLFKYNVANSLAVNRGGYLASMNDEEETLAVSRLLRNYSTGSSAYAYIQLGGYMLEGTNTMLLADGTTSYKNHETAVRDLYESIYFGSPTLQANDFHTDRLLLEYPEDTPDESILATFTQAEWATAIKDNSQDHSYETISAFEENAILNSLYDSNANNRIVLSTSSSNEYFIFAENNYFGTENEKLIQSMITDGDSLAGYADIVTTPYLTLESPELANIYPFVTEAYITDTEGNRITSASKGQEIQIHVKFNRDMNTSVQPMVSFGPAEPYTDYIVDGEFVTAREWVATTKVNGFTDAGTEYIRIKDAQAADDAWLKTGTDEARFAFEINSTGAEALTLQAVGGENKVELTWTQDDYDTLAGFNVYRSTSATGSFTKLNSYLIPGTIREYVDTNVEPGKEYFYYFTVMGTDLQESPASNIASATPIDNIKPTLTHKRIVSANSGEAISFNVTATDNIGIEHVKLYWRVTDGKWNAITMSNTSGNDYFATIAGTNVKPEGIEYYVEVSDGTNTICDGSASYPIKVAVDYSLVIYSVAPFKVDIASTEPVTATLTGVNFSESMTLLVGDTSVVYEFVSTSQISFVIPVGKLGRADITLTDGERKATLANAITYTDSSSKAEIVAPGEAKAKEVIKLPITVTASGEIFGVDLKLQLTYNQYSSIKFEKASGLTSAIATCNSFYSGVVNISIASDEALPNGTVLGYLCLTPNAVTENVSTTIYITSAVANAVEVKNTVDTNLTIMPNFTISGKITYYGTNEGIAGVTVSLNNGMTTVTDENGNYTFTGVTTSKVIITPHFEGHVNNALSAQDASLVLQAITDESVTLSDYQRIAADVDGDGVLTAMDASYILKKIVGKLDGAYPGTVAEWAFVEQAIALDMTANVTNANFTGILLGDVTGNWTSTPIEEVE